MEEGHNSVAIIQVRYSYMHHCSETGSFKHVISHLGIKILHLALPFISIFRQFLLYNVKI